MSGIHLFYEIDFSRAATDGHNPGFASAYPAAQEIFSAGLGMKAPLTRFAEIYPAMRERYPLVLGAKVLDTRPSRIEHNFDLPVIFTMRDVRTWICKNKILDQDSTIAPNIVPAAANFVEYMVTTYLHPKPLRLRMEDMVLDGGMRWAKEIAAFLGGDPDEACDWHQRRDTVWEAGKDYSSWVERKDLAFTIPSSFDTVAEIIRSPFWDALLPIFDKYYQAPNGRFSSAEIGTDRQELRVISQKFHVPLSEAFSVHTSGSFAFTKTNHRKLVGERKNR